MVMVVNVVVEIVQWLSGCLWLPGYSLSDCLWLSGWVVAGGCLVKWLPVVALTLLLGFFAGIIRF